MIPVAHFLAVFCCFPLVTACMPEGSNGLVAMGEETHVCLVINDKHVSVLKPTADDYFRWDLQGSFRQATDCASDFWWGGGTECPFKAARRALDDAELELDPFSAEAIPENSRRLANSTAAPTPSNECTDGESPVLNPGTSFYVESMGVVSNYKKTYVSHCGVGWVFPIITAVIAVDQGVVQSVYWDDGCFMCPDEGNEIESSMQCISNAYTLPGAATRVADGLGKDCGLTATKCRTKSESFCDLNLYVVWTGTDKNGNYFQSAGKRFSRFREYAMPSLFNAMEDLIAEV